MNPYVLGFITDILFPLVAIVGATIGVYMKLQKETIKWRTTFELKVDGIIKDLSELLNENKALVMEMKAVITTQAAITGDLRMLDAKVTSLHTRVDKTESTLDTVREDIIILKSGR